MASLQLARTTEQIRGLNDAAWLLSFKIVGLGL